MIKYVRECRSPHPRLLPTAGVCEQRLGESLRLLLTAGVCEQRLGMSLKHLLIAGVSSRLFPIAGVCDQH